MKKLERKVYDIWNLLDKEFKSKHCGRKKAKAIAYDHTGAILAKCACGIPYWHNQGAYRIES